MLVRHQLPTAVWWNCALSTQVGDTNLPEQQQALGAIIQLRNEHGFVSLLACCETGAAFSLLSTKERNKNGGTATLRYSVAAGVRALSWQF